MAAENKKGWEDMITSTDLIDNSRKAWQTIRKISKDTIAPNHLVWSLLTKLHTNFTSTADETCQQSPTLSQVCKDDSSLVFPFTEEEYKKGIATLKNEKAADIDDVLVEQLNNLAYSWLHSMRNVYFTENRIPNVWRQSKIIAIRKLGKDSAIPKSYRPISLIWHM